MLSLNRGFDVELSYDAGSDQITVTMGSNPPEGHGALGAPAGLERTTLLTEQLSRSDVDSLFIGWATAGSNCCDEVCVCSQPVMCCELDAHFDESLADAPDVDTWLRSAAA
jgi:hypothetical protein